MVAAGRSGPNEGGCGKIIEIISLAWRFLFLMGQQHLLRGALQDVVYTNTVL